MSADAARNPLFAVSTSQSSITVAPCRSSVRRMNSSLHLQILANEAAHRYCADNACKFASTAPPGQREDEASPDSMSATGGTSSVDVSIRNYLAEIYPAGRWFDRTAVPPARARSFFRSLQWFYNTTAAPLPMDALKGVALLRPPHYSCQDGFYASGTLLQRDYADTQYAELLPCVPGLDCLQKQSRFAPSWSRNLDQAHAYLEVTHYALWNMKKPLTDRTGTSMGSYAT